jgi:Gpi18-like mannosyltransferase
VSRPATGEPDRGVEAPTRTRSREAASSILIVLAFGLAFRLILAYLLPGSGFEADLNAFRYWASNLAAEGPFGFYDRPFFHDYTPGYLYVLWLVGIVGSALGGIDDLIKIPAIMADLALGWLVWSMARELGVGRRAALIGGAIVVVNPITWFDSVVWGQVDSVGLVFLLLALRELWRDRPERSAFLAVVAAIIKPQLGILVPIVAAVTIRRALWPDGGHGDEGPPAAAARRTTTGWEARARGPVRILTTGLVGLVTAIGLSAPFGLSIVGLLEQIGTAAAGYPYLTVNAYNPWALLELGGNGLAANGLWVRDLAGPGPGEAAAFGFGPIPAVVAGTALLLVAVAAVTLAVARRPDRRTILVGLVVLAFIFFVVPTRVHERYLFPFFALAAILAACSTRWRVVYLVVSVATFANMYVVLTTLYPDNPSIADWLGIGPAIRSRAGVTIVALAHTAAFGWVAAQLLDGALRRLRAELAMSRLAPPPLAARGETGGGADVLTDGPPDLAPAGPTGPPAPRSAASHAPAAAARQLPVALDEPPRPPTWGDRPSLAEVGAWEWLRSRIGERPIRPDRTALLHGERGGRLDRLDAWILVVLVVAVFGTRLWRLAEPYQMHFDEVYHARTATEFLQHWRYGISHDIYEWTHPHLAKYAMAGGLVAWGDDRVSATSELGVPVLDAAIEPRYDDPLGRRVRSGDRLHVATGSEVRSYDLATRGLVAVTPVAGASAVAVDRAAHRLIIGTDAGAIAIASLPALDEARAAGVDSLTLGTQELARLDGPISRLHVTEDGSALVALVGQRVVMLDAEGAVTGEVALGGVAQFADAGRGAALVADTAAVTDVDAAAGALSDLLGGGTERYAGLLSSGGAGIVLGTVPPDRREAVDAAIGDGRLAGIAVSELPRVAVAAADGITFLVPAAGEASSTLALDGGASGVVLVTGIDDPKLYLTTNAPDGPKYGVVVVGGDDADQDPGLSRTYPLPGRGSWVAYDEASQQVHILGRVPDGGAPDDAAEPTVYVIEPHANAVYADARLAGEPVAWAMDSNSLYPAEDRQQLLVFEASGTAATIEVGSHAFAWRMPGIIGGTLMAALLYLLARMLFRRREVAVFLGILLVADGMLFVQSRIGMNDAYVGLFIVAAYALFAAIWTGSWRWRGAFWLTMPAIGLLLGLALASKWVAAYAIGALGILILARSALGRLVLLAGIIVVTTVLGYLAISVPEGQTGGNLTFALIMIALTLTAVVVTVLHPIGWSDDELRFAVGAPLAAGGVVALAALALGTIDGEIVVGSLAVTPLEVALGLALLSVVIAVLFWLAGRWGFGPLAAPPGPDDPAALLGPPAPAATGWLRPGWALGLPVAWMVASLLVIPLAVYVASYVPWAFVENHQLFEGWPPGNHGQTLLTLTGDMYRYHNTLSSPHAASSPWWAWPFDLKPVWFYQESFAGGTSASIYDAGNLAIWWLGVPAMAFISWQAFRRRSLALALIAIGFACQWVPWARIDRAAFQYHYYTSLPFMALGLAYFLAELWHGASRRTWLLARVTAAAAIVAPAAMWLFHRPLCGFVGVERVNPGSQACPTLIPDFVLTWRSAALVVVVGLAVLVLVRQLLRIQRPAEADLAEGGAGGGPIRAGLGAVRALGAFGPALASVVLAAIALAVVTAVAGEIPILTLRNVAVEPVAILVALPLLFVASFVVTARDARRFVVGAVLAIVVTAIFFYPNVAALPLPAPIVNMYQGILPTYVYPFQFPVSTVDRNVAGPSLLALGPAMLLAALTVASAVVAYSAWVWRIALAEREAGDPDDGGGALAGTGA